jgi:hypothetical protein
MAMLCSHGTMESSFNWCCIILASISRGATTSMPYYGMGLRKALWVATPIGTHKYVAGATYRYFFK